MNFDYVPLGEAGWIWIPSEGTKHVDFGNVERIACRRVTGLKDTYPEVFAGIEYACVMEYIGAIDNNNRTIELSFLTPGDIVYVPEFNLDTNGLMPGAFAHNDLYKINSDGTTSTLLVEGYISLGEILPGGWEGKTIPYILQLQESLDSTNVKLDASNIKLDSELALTEGIRGAVVDVKNQPTDACIIRIYVGDQTNKRNAAAREITRLLGEGYRPYQTFGISEDLARVLFVKYPEPNDANPVEP